ncbi:response regulator transcription factor [Planotetraspora sp. GP83]|uniref:response regulator n=1 Tax=Planotetraspora sp. GP83 TaxID=3156264 RepID=UPI003514D6BF
MRVVIVESTPSLRDALVQLLSERGVEVIGTAADAAEGLRAVAATTPDVVIIDVRLPPDHTDEGLGTAEAIRARHPTIGLVVLSTRAEPAYAHRLVSLRPPGSVGYIIKERLGDPDALTAALHRVHTGEVVIDPYVSWPDQPE